jgi:hypothetical protein
MPRQVDLAAAQRKAAGEVELCGHTLTGRARDGPTVRPELCVGIVGLDRPTVKTELEGEVP